MGLTGRHLNYKERAIGGLHVSLMLSRVREPLNNLDHGASASTGSS
jgi:hypothetical protein